MKTLASLLLLALAYFGTGDARAQKSKKDGPVHCVITDEKIASPQKAHKKITYQNQTLYFCCPGCVSLFEKSSPAEKAKFVQISERRAQKAGRRPAPVTK